MKAAPNPNSSVPQLNMTSMIDVIFLLLIFFVFTADFDRIERLLPANLSLPGRTKKTENSAEKPESEILTIKVHGTMDAPSWEFDTGPVSEAELTAGIAQFARQTALGTAVIVPDGTVPLERVLDVYDRCRRAGLTQIQFAAKKK